MPTPVFHAATTPLSPSSIAFRAAGTPIAGSPPSSIGTISTSLPCKPPRELISSAANVAPFSIPSPAACRSPERAASRPMRKRSELLDDESSEPPQAASPRVRADAAKAAAAKVRRLESAIWLRVSLAS
jgi:hypothetical protein